MPYAMEFQVVGPESVPGVLIASYQRDEAARRVIIAIGKALVNVAEKAKTPHPMLCMCLDCNTVFSERHTPIAFGITLPMFPDEQNDLLIASGICAKCFARSDLKQAVIRSLRKLHGADATFRDMELEREH